MRRSLSVLAILCALASLAPTGLARLASANYATPPIAASASSNGAALALAERDQRRIAAARPDERNLYDLTRRLKLHSHTPINPYIRATPPDYQVGRTDTFYVAKATSGYFTMKATLFLKTAHAYWYVAQNMDIPHDTLMTLLRKSAHDFETHVYPTDHRAFGQEWTPGIDRDPRITVLNADLPGVGGYYSAEDLYPRTVNPYSNERKMLYISITSYPLGTGSYDSTIAHELQHMIHWNQHERDDAWINEGSSVLAQVLNGYDADGQDGAFANAPGTQLDDFCYGAPDCSDGASIAHYGAGFLWMLYLYQHYGGDKALRTMLTDKALSGMALFDDVLARLGSHDRARDMFRKWVIANLVDDPRLDGGAYGYQNVYPGCCVHASLTASTHSYPYTRHATVNQFATDYVELKPGQSSTLHLTFAGDPTVHIVDNTPVQGNSEWWSDRGDEVDSTLTRTLDLRRVRHATLQYDVWYDVEQDFDYGYVEVSTDGGSTWHTLHTPYTTNADPNGANYGNGYTGQSQKVKGNKNGWLHESIDLSRYAGHKIQVRFEQITDDAYNRAGITLDNIRVPQIGLADAPGDPGWTSHGWTRVANLLPTGWLVQLVLYTNHGVQVRQVQVSELGHGQATISGLGGDVKRAVLAISPTAPQTTIPSSYTLTVK